MYQKKFIVALQGCVAVFICAGIRIVLCISRLVPYKIPEEPHPILHASVAHPLPFVLYTPHEQKQKVIHCEYIFSIRGGGRGCLVFV